MMKLTGLRYFVFLKLVHVFLVCQLARPSQQQPPACNNPVPLMQTSGAIERAQITVPGFAANDLELNKLRFNTGAGLCINSSEAQKTITVDFQNSRQAHVVFANIFVQLSNDWKAEDGYVKTYKMRYENNSGSIHDFSGTYNGPQNPGSGRKDYGDGEIDEKNYKAMKKIFIDITDYDKSQQRICLRVELFGCQEDVCQNNCENGGKCMDTNYCECLPNYTPPDEQCRYHYPNMTYSPSIEVADAVQGDNTVTFTCTVPHPRSDIKHTAQWYVDLGHDKALVHNGSQSDSTIISEINQRDIYDSLEKLENRTLLGNNWALICIVTACDTMYCGNASSPPMSSEGISAKASLDKTAIEVTEGEGGKVIGVTLHGPPVLFHGSRVKHNGSDTVIEAKFDIDKLSSSPCKSGNLPVVTLSQIKPLKHCGPMVTSENWNETHMITIAAVTDGLITEQKVTRKCTIILKHVDNIGNSVASDIEIGKVDVVVRNMDGWAKSASGQVSWSSFWDKRSACKSFTDPHIRTFDGTTFLLPTEGEYVLYRNKDHGIQVNIISVDCGDLTEHIRGHVGVTCTCGVAIKVGDDVIRLGNCQSFAGQGRRQFHFKVSAFLNGVGKDNMKKLTDGTRIYSVLNGTRYFVYLPTGTYVHVQPNWEIRKFIDVFIVPSLSDRETSDGICGFYDGNCTYDLRDAENNTYNGNNCSGGSKAGYNAFLKKWKAEDPCSSLLMGTHAETTFKSIPIYCRCVLGSDTQDCGRNMNVRPCPPDYGNVVINQRLVII